MMIGIVNSYSIIETNLISNRVVIEENNFSQLKRERLTIDIKMEDSIVSSKERLESTY